MTRKREKQGAEEGWDVNARKDVNEKLPTGAECGGGGYDVLLKKPVRRKGHSKDGRGVVQVGTGTFIDPGTTRNYVNQHRFIWVQIH